MTKGLLIFRTLACFTAVVMIPATAQTPPNPAAAHVHPGLWPVPASPFRTRNSRSALRNCSPR